LGEGDFGSLSKTRDESDAKGARPEKGEFGCEVTIGEEGRWEGRSAIGKPGITFSVNSEARPPRDLTKEAKGGASTVVTREEIASAMSSSEK
jgi:hypothetical protein